MVGFYWIQYILKYIYSVRQMQSMIEMIIMRIDRRGGWIEVLRLVRGFFFFFLMFMFIMMKLGDWILDQCIIWLKLG